MAHDYRLAESILSMGAGGDRLALAARALDAGRRLFGAAAAGLFLFDRAGGASQVVPASGASAGFVDEYERGLRQIDPVLRCVCHVGRSSSARRSIAASDWDRAAIADHLGRWGFGDSMQGPLCRGGRIIGTLNLVRSRSDAPFASDDLAALDLLCRALSNAFEAEERLVAAVSLAACAAPKSSVVRLEGRARDVGLLLIDGATNKVMARRLGISELTAKEHVERLRARFGAANRTQLAARLASLLASTTESG